MAARLERAGVGAIVLPSLFEEEILAEEIELNRSLEQGTEQFAEALDYFPAIDRVRRRGRPLPRARSSGSRPRSTVPVIASLNADTHRRLGPLRPPHPGRRRRRARAEPVPRRRRPAPVGRPTWRRPTSS